jgi:hypothetical protein
MPRSGSGPVNRLDGPEFVRGAKLEDKVPSVKDTRNAVGSTEELTRSPDDPRGNHGDMRAIDSMSDSGKPCTRDWVPVVEP